MSRQKTTLWWWIGGCGCAGVIGLAVVGLVAWKLLSPAASPSFYAGDGTYEAVLQSTGGDGEADGTVIERRLETLGVDGEVTEAGPGRIVLTVHDVSGPEAIEAVVPQRSLSFHLEAEAADSLMPGSQVVGTPPPGVRPDADVVQNRTIPTWVGPDAESLAPILARIPPAATITPMVECGQAEWDEVTGRECRVRIVEATPLVTGADVVDAEVQMDEMTGEPRVMIDLSDEGARRFADGTARGTGRRLAIVVDHEIVSFPVIMERISGGRAMITPGAHPAGGQMAYAQSMVAAFRSGALAAPWEIASIRRVD